MKLKDYPIDHSTVPHTRMVPPQLLCPGISIVVHGSLIVTIIDIEHQEFSETMSITYRTPTHRVDSVRLNSTTKVETIALSEAEETMTLLSGELWIDKTKYNCKSG